MSRFPRNDNEWREYIIEKVKPYFDGKGYELSFDSSYCIGCPDNSVEPKVGDTLRMYGPLFGTVRGMFIDGFKVYYRTEKQQDVLNKKESKRFEREKRESYKQNKESYQLRIKTLPKEFRKRIAKFRKNNRKFNWQYLGYELFGCEQAVVIANICRTVKGIENFVKLSFDEQLALIPETAKEAYKGHSGNTHGFAIYMAKCYLTNPNLVVEQHGAMSTLVGCKEYGCHNE